MTRERPIPFSAPMVRAILAGTKTQTRRVVKFHVFGAGPLVCEVVPSLLPNRGDLWDFRRRADNPMAVRCPYGKPGDRLWVREAWSIDIDHDHLPPRDTAEGSHAWYEADRGLSAIRGLSRMGRLRRSFHMPRWASRITLEITGVRVERLQDISEADAVAEGIERGDTFPGWFRYGLAGDSDGLAEAGRSGRVPTAFPRLAYRALWESINGLGSWDENPWVWVVEFERKG